MQSWVFVFVMHLCLYLYLHLFLYLNLHLCLYLYLYLFASVCTAMHCIDQSGYAVAKPWVFPGDRSRRSPPSSLQEGHWPRETVSCHQLSSVVIRCHQMSTDVVGGHQVDLLYSWSVWYSTVKSHHHHHHTWDTGQEKLSVMSSWCMGLSKYIKCSWIMIMIKSHQYQRRSIISNVNTL